MSFFYFGKTFLTKLRTIVKSFLKVNKRSDMLITVKNFTPYLVWSTWKETCAIEIYISFDIYSISFRSKDSTIFDHTACRYLTLFLPSSFGQYWSSSFVTYNGTKYPIRFCEKYQPELGPFLLAAKSLKTQCPC